MVRRGEGKYHNRSEKWFEIKTWTTQDLVVNAGNECGVSECYLP